MAWPYRGVLLDLFGTLVAFDRQRLPELEVGGGRMRTTVGALGGLLAEWVPGTAPADFLHALLSVSEEMAQARAYDHVELPSRERFRRALERVGCDDGVIAEAAVHLSRAHMAVIAEATVLPPAHADLLAALQPRYRLGVVSNFDDTAAAYDILLRHGVASRLDTIVVSEALGLRKPHPAVIRVGLRGLGLEAGEVLMVGDTYDEDVAGARAAGVDAAWIDTAGRGVPAGDPPPRYVVRALPELAHILEGP
jgi:FMN phosphatase YigB (HAD superfamily)